MDVDAGPSLHPDFFLSNGSSGQGPQLLQSDSNMSLEERLFQGQDEDLLHVTGSNREEVLKILHKTENGRRRAEEIFGPDIWDSRRGKNFDRPSKVGQSQPEDDKEVDKMFLDLTNADEDDVSKKDRQPEGERVSITAASFDAERNTLDMEDSD
ncbi:hypothetical protein O1611_g5528 [Lasiodiplodia mahajangana]|uniref:Uncharacterized protein n=1 Tax=Lasiodiplodia mahajangana TaxID=1108764 RepID=A0ACC2JKX9_9PEZI|nr:hypothetical protein O1611_g5528 [Lasiodiplodia mahajangana]